MTLLHWIKEREAIRLRRAAGESRPWTKDPILAEWSFCNVRREHDRVTRWIATNWREPHADDPDLWFGMAVARFVNWPDTLAELAWPVVRWDAEIFKDLLGHRQARGDKVFGDAYNIPNGGKTTPKVTHVADAILTPLWAGRLILRPKSGEKLAAFHGRLMGRPYLGSFYAAQIVADMKQVLPLKDAEDWSTFAASGPGSRRGLNRLLGRPIDNPWSKDDYAWRLALRRLHETITPELEQIGIGRLCAQDLQNCLCEFDKYERMRLGEGKPKRRYMPHD
jgi:alpha-glutamyl/putrescinyl thymine pyrophosphorylase clade 1